MLSVIPIVSFQSLPGKVWLRHWMNERWNTEIPSWPGGWSLPANTTVLAQTWWKCAISWKKAFFSDNMVMKTPSYLSLLLGFANTNTGPATINANNLDSQCSPLHFPFTKSSWLMTWHTSLLVRNSNVKISIPTASWWLLYSNHSNAAFLCHRDTHRAERAMPVMPYCK